MAKTPGSTTPLKLVLAGRTSQALLGIKGVIIVVIRTTALVIIRAMDSRGREVHQATTRVSKAKALGIEATGMGLIRQPHTVPSVGIQTTQPYRAAPGCRMTRV